MGWAPPFKTLVRKQSMFVQAVFVKRALARFPMQIRRMIWANEDRPRAGFGKWWRVAGLRFERFQFRDGNLQHDADMRSRRESGQSLFRLNDQAISILVRGLWLSGDHFAR
jgi:hypothetical protein